MQKKDEKINRTQRLNAPFGARCFLTDEGVQVGLDEACQVLMHLLALGAF